MRRLLIAAVGTAFAGAVSIGVAGQALADPMDQPILPPGSMPLVGPLLPPVLFMSPNELKEAVVPPSCPPGNLFVINGDSCIAIG